MLYRKIEHTINQYFSSREERVLIVTGARQVGKSYIVRHCARQHFRHVVELNMVDDSASRRLFAEARTTEEFYIALGIAAGRQLGTANDTLVFIDEIQQYPHLLTLLKFLNAEGRFRYVASGSLLGVTLRRTTSIPIGSIRIEQMYPLDFEEFLLANGFAAEVVDHMRQAFGQCRSLDEAVHREVMRLFRLYLLVGGLPAAVNEFLASRNIVAVRKIHRDVHQLYVADASKYDEEHRLRIERIYGMIPSNMENKKKRLVFKDIQPELTSARAAQYVDEMDYLVGSGTALEVKAISNPKFPLIESEQKNLVKFYLNDVGLLTRLLFRENVDAVLTDQPSINLGSVYECVVAMELAAHDHRIFYYDNRQRGEVDFLVDDYQRLSVLPIEVKSGKDYKRHSAVSRMVSTDDYHIERAIVFSNSRDVETPGRIVYMPIYYVMFVSSEAPAEILL
jgi:hypothetical protein